MADEQAKQDDLSRAADMARAETGARTGHGVTRGLLFTVAVAWSLFQLWIASPLPFVVGFGIFTDYETRAIHLAFALFLAYTAFPGSQVDGRSRRILPLLYLAAAAFLAWRGFGFAATGADEATAFFAMTGALLLAAWMAWQPGAVHRIPAVDWLLALAASATALYLFVFYRDLAMRPGNPTIADLAVAGVGLVLLLEAARRTLGLALPIVALVFLFYTFAGPWMPDLIAHRGFSFSRTMSQQWLTQEGVFGIALGVSTSFVFLFVLFGSMLEKAGAGNYFIKVSFAFLGHLRGGPAKAAVVSSGLTGIISGSSIANVVTTGTFTIPLMKRVGYPPEKAGAVEVAASVNGQIMPPVMGAAAFLMVEYVGIPYTEVIRHAFVPAIITYIALLYIVHLEALKAGMQGLPRRGTDRSPQRRILGIGLTVSAIVVFAGLVYYGIKALQALLGPAADWVILPGLLVAYVALVVYAARVPDLETDDPEAPIEDLPEAGPTLRTGLYFLLPIVVLIWCLMIEHLSPGLSAFYATLFMIFILLTQRPIQALVRRHDVGSAALAGVRDLFESLEGGARNMVGIGIATAAAGIVVGTVAMTGIGQVMTSLVESLSGGNLMVMLVLVAVVCIILGMGLPTTANYIVVASLMANVVVELGSQAGLAVPLIAVHLFVFYFGLMADVTPPVGLASFAASAISRADPIRTGIQAFIYESRTVILPFMFIFNTKLLLIGIDGPLDLAITVFGALSASLLFTAGTQGWFVTRSRWYESLLLLLVAFTLFRPGFWWDRIEPPYQELPASALIDAAGEVPQGALLRFRVTGLDLDGDEVTRSVALPMGAPGPGAKRLQAQGLSVMALGDRVQVLNVDFASPAERAGIENGFDITAVRVPHDRLAKEIMYLPAFLLLALVWWLQRRRTGSERGLRARTA